MKELFEQRNKEIRDTELSIRRKEIDEENEQFWIKVRKS